MADETQEEEQFEVSERVKARLRGAQWTIEDLRASERTFRDGEDETTGEPKEQVRKRVTLIRKCEWPEKMDAEEAVKYLASPACKEVLRLCGEGLEGKDWEPRFAWFKQDNEQGRARSGYLYHALRLFDAHGEDGPYVVEESCLSRTEATFYWGVKQPPEVPEAESGVTYELNIRGYEDETGEYDCILMRRENLGYNMPVYETHEETGETRLRSEMLGVREDETTVDEKVADYAEEQGLELVDGPKTLDDGKTVVGVVVDLQKQKNRDCTTDVTLQNTHEEESTDHVVEKRVTVRGEQTATTHLHITAEKADEYKAGYEVEDKDGTLKAGTLTVTHVEKTPGGVRNVTVTKTVSTPVAADAGNTVCAKTIYEHVHTTLAENQKAATREPDDVEKWAGAYEQVQVIANDDGTFNEEVKKTTELEVDDAQKETTTDYFGTTTRTLGQNLKQETAGKDAWNPKNQVVQATSPDDGTGVSGGGDDRNNVAVQKQEIVTPGGVRNIQITTQTASPATAKATFGADPNGRQTTVGWFRNLTKTEAETFIAGFSGGSIQRNAFGLYDGTCSYTTAGDGGGSGGGKYTEFEETRTVQSGRMASNGGSLFKITEVFTYITGICHDSDPTPTSQTSPYAKVAGCIDARVSNLGEGYWSYYGITEKTERWEYVGEMPTATTTGILEATWKASDVTNPGGEEDKDA